METIRYQDRDYVIVRVTSTMCLPHRDMQGITERTFQTKWEKVEQQLSIAPNVIAHFSVNVAFTISDAYFLVCRDDEFLIKLLPVHGRGNVLDIELAHRYEVTKAVLLLRKLALLID